MTKTLISFSFVLAAAIGAGGCTSSSSPKSTGGTGSGSSAVVIDDAARKEAAELFGSRCQVCHGPSGEGNGPASAGLTPKPRNFTDKTWQASVTDEHIEKIIQYGGAAVGKSPAMPPNPDLTAKAATVAALREHVRSLSK